LRVEWVATPVGRVRLVRAGPAGTPALLCWPGLGWVAEAFTRLLREADVEGLQVVALDPPGHGHSDPAPTLTWPDAGLILADLARAVGADRYVLVGHSIGAIACVMGSPVLADGAAGLLLADGGVAPVFQGCSDADLAAANDRWFEEEARFADWPSALAWARADLAGWDADVEAGVRGALREDGQGRIVARGDSATLTRWSVLARAYDPLTARWPSCPVLAVLGGDGHASDAQVEQLRTRVPRLEVARLATAGHELLWDRPGEMSARIWHFAHACLARPEADSRRGRRDG